MRLAAYALIASLAGASFVALLGQAQHSNIVPKIPVKLSECILHVDGKALKPIRVGNGFLTHTAIPTGSIESDGRTIDRLDSRGEKAWSVKTPGPRKLQVASTSANVVYLIELPNEEEYTFSSSQVHRLDIQTGKWLSPIKLGGTLQAKQSVSIVGICARANRLAVLYQILGTASESDALVRRTVGVYGEHDSKPSWTYNIPLEKDSAPRQGVLLAASYPNFADSDVTTLAWVGKSVVACPDAMGPIVTLDGGNGKVAWTLKRPWEYQRGFIGPSVWSHYVSRFGNDYFDRGINMDKLRSQFEKSFSGQIIGGPVWVPFPKSSDSREEGVFLVVVTLASKLGSGYDGYVGDAILYEVSERGDVLSRTPLPQYVIGRQVFCRPNEAIWSTKNNGMMSVCVEDKGLMFSIGPGGPDHTGKIRWFVQPPDSTPEDKWLTHEAARNVTAFAENRAYRANGGWYVDGPDDRTLTFPIQVFDLTNGVTRNCSLEVPVTYKVMRPTTNFRGNRGGIYGLGPGNIGIIDITATASRVRIQLATDKGVSFLDFNLKQ